MNPPTVSVIIPAFNSESTIADTLSSVFAQTFSDFEVIVIDDGSIDRTGEIITNEFGGDRRLVFERQENRGVAETRNKAISLSRSKLIAPLDDDDVWHPTYLERQVKTLEQNQDTALVYAWVWYIDALDNVLLTFHWPVVQGAVFAQQLYWNMVGNGSAIVFRKAVAIEFGGYDSRVVGAEDWMLQLKIASRYKYSVTPAYLVGYRKHAKNLSNDTEQMYQTCVRLLGLVRQECENVPDCAVRWSLAMLHFRRGEAEYLAGSRWKAAEKFLSAGACDPIGTFALFTRFLLQRAEYAARQLMRNKSSSGAAPQKPDPFLLKRPDERVLPIRRVLSLRQRRLEHLRQLDLTRDIFGC